MSRNNFAYLSLFFSGKDRTELLLYLELHGDARKCEETAKYFDTRVKRFNILLAFINLERREEIAPFSDHRGRAARISERTEELFWIPIGIM